MCKEAFQNCPASLLRGERMLVIPVFSAGPQAAPEHAQALGVVDSSPLSLVVLNRFPYSNGHVLVAPVDHLSTLEDLSDEVLLDLQKELVRWCAILKKVLGGGFQHRSQSWHCQRCRRAGTSALAHRSPMERRCQFYAKHRGHTSFAAVACHSLGVAHRGTLRITSKFEKPFLALGKRLKA